MNQMKKKSHSICLLASSGRGETVLEETLEAEKLHGFKVGKDFSPYTFTIRISTRKEMRYEQLEYFNFSGK